MLRTIQFVSLLALSNLFMTIAWYGHLKHRHWPLIVAVLVSWLIALAEYALQVPANRIGYEKFSLTQLKVMQECITLIIFLAYAYVAFQEPIKWNSVVSMILIVFAVAFAFWDK